MLDEIRGRLARELPAPIARSSTGMLVGTAGTVTTLAALDLELAAYDSSRVHGHRLTRAAVDRLLARLGALTVAERGALPCLEPGRADLIIPGTAIVVATMERFGVDDARRERLRAAGRYHGHRQRVRVMSPRSLLLALSQRPKIGAAMDRLPLTRRFVRRFVAGQTADDAFRVIGDLDRRGLATAVTYLGENVVTPGDAEQATRVYLDLLDRIARARLRCLPSLKLTHLGLDLGEELCLANLTRLLDRARRRRHPRLDRHGVVGLHRPDARPLREGAPSVIRTRPSSSSRISGGRRTTSTGSSSSGPPFGCARARIRNRRRSPIPTRRDVDAAYRRLIERLLADDARTAGVYPGFATHDERMQQHAVATARSRNVPATAWEIQMLFGIRHDLHAALQAAGVPLRVLVPYGEDWYGYFMRRLAERPANVLFLLRNLR